ncbi:DUF63 family protein [Natronomonas sp. EA1]|uniref:DUF63 family protein n=1 Tax=Natronomonas sp. EA1 TaxID=3421655 RepID=UPI003EBD7C71
MELSRMDTGRLWLGTFGTALVAFTVGALVAPGLVWDRFLWHYFWGPIYADANNAVCAVMEADGPALVYSTATCESLDAAGRIVAEPGYTLVSEVGYAVTLVFMLVGVLELLDRLDVGRTKEFFYALFPFMFFGGALRVVEDANDAVPQGIEPFLAYPWNTLIISPIIYFTVFFITLAALVVAVAAYRRGLTDSYHRPLVVTGSVLTLATVAYLTVFVSTTLAGAYEGPGLYPQMTLLTLGIALALTYVVYEGIERYKPEINAGTGRVGFVVIFGHAVDGVANVIAADWINAIGVPVDYGAKHPVNRAIINATEAIQPEALSTLIGTSWPFLVVKLIAASAVVWVFDPEIFEENPRYAILLLVAILAVGLGPGTRDMLRATFGI